MSLFTGLIADNFLSVTGPYGFKRTVLLLLLHVSI